MLRVCPVIIHSAKCISITKNATATDFLKPQLLLVQSTRNTNFFNRRSGTELWKGVTTVSNAGRRRGRAKGLIKMKNLNKGQKLGCGKEAILFPGLNANVMQGNYIYEQRVLTSEEQQNIPVTPVANSVSKRRVKVHPLMRGWSGGSPGGKKIGPPDPVDGDAFEGFETIILESNYRSRMTSVMGRSQYYYCMVITGNRNGLIGFAKATGTTSKSVLITAKNRAGKRLMCFERYNDHTGYGLKCHRAIRACCELIGIKDMHAKIEGSTNVGNIIKAFFFGLLQQKTHEQMAEEKQLHLVELRKENNYFPTVLASPAKVRTEAEIPSNELLDFDRYIMNGRVRLMRKKNESTFKNLPSWLIYRRKQERLKGQEEVLIRAKAEYGDYCSFHAAKYPEAAGSKWKKHDKKV
ncbi:unnamed protein product [Xylocopa violacea]|uniref:Small ribosomal subunit protein uS5m n=1 Tax=Xylocopa violacea TaxID=135666 RepID=A0ABP1P8J5_XYLVO